MAVTIPPPLNDNIEVIGEGLAPNTQYEIDGHDSNGTINIGVFTTRADGGFGLTDSTAPVTNYVSLTLNDPTTDAVLLTIPQVANPTSGFHGEAQNGGIAISDSIGIPGGGFQPAPAPLPPLGGNQGPPPSTVPTDAQLKTIVTDTLKFFADKLTGKSTTTDLTNLTNAVKAVNLTEPTLAQVLTSALQNLAGSNASTLANDLAGQYIGKINTDTASGSSALPRDLAALVGETVLVGATYHGLAQHEPAQTALNQTVSLFRIG